MLDIKLIREKPELVRENLKRRLDPSVLENFEKVLKIDKEWRKVIQELNELRKRKNEINFEIIRLKKEGKDIREIVREMHELPDKIKELENKESQLKEELDSSLMRLPNLLDDSVPFGKDEKDNVEIRRWGKPTDFKFKPKNHVEILTKLGIFDGERGAKVAGNGFFYNKEELALLDMVLQKFAIDFLRKRGYKLINPPYLMRRKPYEGVTDLSDFENVMYKIEGEDLYLIATSEHPIAAMFMDEVIDKKDLPLKFCGISPCFRKEVGSHGKYTKGLFRMHQFHKVEQFIFCLPEDSWKYHEELQKNTEGILKMLGLSHRVVNVCTGDIGTVAAKKYDTEIWMSDGEYREVASNSNCTDYQARRLNIKYREVEGQPPKGFVHTLNSTGLATSRVMIAIIEQNQQEDGSVVIPEVLRDYMDGVEKLEIRD
ncbi:MAG: serine--tRNA ligase [Candidatus Aenigmatarchaeota archaeon]